MYKRILSLVCLFACVATYASQPSSEASDEPSSKENTEEISNPYLPVSIPRRLLKNIPFTVLAILALIADFMVLFNTYSYMDPEKNPKNYQPQLFERRPILAPLFHTLVYMIVFVFETFLGGAGGGALSKTKILDLHDQKAAWWRLILRTLVKYPPLIVFTDAFAFELVEEKRFKRFQYIRFDKNNKDKNKNFENPAFFYLVLVFIGWIVFVPSLSSLFGKKKRALQDLVAGTVVVQKEEEA